MEAALPQLPEVPEALTAADPASAEVDLPLEAIACAVPSSAFERRRNRRPDWFCSFLAGNTREKTRFRTELATMKGSVVWLVRQRRLGAWSATEREHLRQVMRSASAVSPYLLIWVVPGSLLLLPFLAWFIDRRRRKVLKTTES